MVRRHLFTAGLAGLILAGCTGPVGTTGTGEERIVSLQGTSGAYVSCDLADGDPMRGRLFCSSPYIGEWERFTLVRLGGDKVAFRAKNMKFVAAELDNGAYLIADRSIIGPFETFELIVVDAKTHVLKAHNGRFVSMPDSTGLLFAAAADTATAERFRVIEDPRY